MENKNSDNSKSKDSVKKINELDSEKVSGGSNPCIVCGSTDGAMRSSDGLCSSCLSKGYNRGCCADCGEIKIVNAHGRCSQCAKHYGYRAPRRY